MIQEQLLSHEVIVKWNIYIGNLKIKFENRSFIFDFLNRIVSRKAQ